MYVEEMHKKERTGFVYLCVVIDSSPLYGNVGVEEGQETKKMWSQPVSCGVDDKEDVEGHRRDALV